MRAFIIATLDFIAITLVVILTLAGLIMGFAAGGSSGPYGQHTPNPAFIVVGGLCGFAIGTLFAGTVLAINETAKNTRRCVELLQKLNQH